MYVVCVCVSACMCMCVRVFYLDRWRSEQVGREQVGH